MRSLGLMRVSLQEYLQLTENGDNMIDATKILEDGTAERILLNAYKKPKTAKQISDNTGIPLVNVYKKIRELEKMGLIEKERSIITKSGRQKAIYRSKLEDAYVFFDNGRLKVRFEVAAGMATAFRNRYRATTADFR